MPRAKTVQHADESIKQLLEKTALLEAALKQVRSEQETLKQQLGIEGKLLEALRQELVLRNDEILSLQENIQKKKGRISELKKAVRFLQNELAAKQQENSELRSELDGGRDKSVRIKKDASVSEYQVLHDDKTPPLTDEPALSPDARNQAANKGVAKEQINQLVSGLREHIEQLSTRKSRFCSHFFHRLHFKNRNTYLKELSRIVQSEFSPDEKLHQFKDATEVYLAALIDHHSVRYLSNFYEFFDGAQPTKYELEQLWKKEMSIDLEDSIINKMNQLAVECKRQQKSSRGD
ncbi:hypothetical protein [Legionella spiritensis]|uniref:hypothetical protein n=1 Tax=Legionella spiritensis TaxID=452 RepID=UPI000F6C5732|nr:hypothetical protein [Legionella spiritensis]VEG91296.1 Uncharacterised protein [Legionella spiritensis]